MVKRLFLFLVFVLIAIIIVVYFSGKSNFSTSRKLSDTPVSPTPDVEGISVVTLGEDKFAYAILKVRDTEVVDLKPNFSEQKITEELMNEKICKYLVNAGFYQKDFTPIGLFIVNGKVIKKEIKSETFNGFFTIDSEGFPTVGSKLPSVPLKYGLQSGPLLILNSKLQELKITNDDNARRIIAAIGRDNRIVFIVIYNANFVFSGPNLAALPSLLQEIAKLENEIFISAINLDGGSASSFWGEGINLIELSPIGSYFCIN